MLGSVEELLSVVVELAGLVNSVDEFVKIVLSVVRIKPGPVVSVGWVNSEVLVISWFVIPVLDNAVESVMSVLLVVLELMSPVVPFIVTVTDDDEFVIFVINSEVLVSDSLVVELFSRIVVLVFSAVDESV